MEIYLLMLCALQLVVLVFFAVRSVRDRERHREFRERIERWHEQSPPKFPCDPDVGHLFHADGAAYRFDGKRWRPYAL